MLNTTTQFKQGENGNVVLISDTVHPAERTDMGEANNVFNVFMNKPERIRSILEYFIKEKLPEDWNCNDESGFHTVRNSKGKVSFRQRDILKRITTAEKYRFSSALYIKG